MPTINSLNSAATMTPMYQKQVTFRADAKPANPNENAIWKDFEKGYIYNKQSPVKMIAGAALLLIGLGLAAAHVISPQTAAKFPGGTAIKNFVSGLLGKVLPKAAGGLTAPNTNMIKDSVMLKEANTINYMKQLATNAPERFAEITKGWPEFLTKTIKG